MLPPYFATEGDDDVARQYGDFSTYGYWDINPAQLQATQASWVMP